MQLELIGTHPFSRDEQGQQLTRIGTLFLESCTLYTKPPGLHAWQRLNFIEFLNTQREAQALPRLTLEQEQRLVANSVDLGFDTDHILIRPDPERMSLAFTADELPQRPKPVALDLDEPGWLMPLGPPGPTFSTFA